MVSSLHTLYNEGWKWYLHHRYNELWHKGYCHISQHVIYAPEKTHHLHFRTSQLDHQAKQLRFKKNLKSTLKYKVDSIVPSHFCKFKHPY